MSDADDASESLQAQARLYRERNGLPDDAPLSFGGPGRINLTLAWTMTLPQAEHLFDLIEQNPWRFPDMPKSRWRQFADRLLWWP